MTVLKYSLLILLSHLSNYIFSQDRDIGYKKEFYKSQEDYKSDESIYNFYKKSKRQKTTATTLGVLSIASIAAGTYAIIQHEPTGQSADIAIVPVVFGAYSFGAIIGTIGLLIKSSSHKNKNKAISMYEEKYGLGINLSDEKNGKYILKANLNSNGVGIVMVF